METFISRSLTKIKKATRGRHPELKAACEGALGKLSESKKNRDARENAEQYFEPFKLACESQHAGIMEEALDCLQKLIAYGYLRGTARRATRRLESGGSALGDDYEQVEKEGAASLSSMDAIVGTICACDDFDDDSVQLQVIKALLTAVTSNTCEIHEGSLLIAVRSCYNIHLVTKNQVNKTTAKATLTQMLSIVFQRMEAYDQRTRLSSEKNDGASAAAAAAAAALAQEVVANSVDVEPVVAVVVPAAAETEAAAAAAPSREGEEARRFKEGDAVAVSGFGDGELKELRDDGSCVVALNAWRYEDGRPALLYAETSVLREPDPEHAPPPRIVDKEAPPEGATIRDDGTIVVVPAAAAAATTKEEEDEEEEAAAAAAAEVSKETEEAPVVPPSPSVMTAGAAKDGPLQPAQYFDDDDEEDDDEEEEEDEEDDDEGTPTVADSPASMEAAAAAAAAAAKGGPIAAARSLAQATPFPSPYHKDAFLLFRALCKLSMKDHDEVEPPVEPISMQSKALSLELLLSVLEHAGPSFCNGIRFVGAVRQYLCVSLLKNCTSNVTHVVALSLRIFVNLIVKLRQHLKAEVEVFISHIFLRVLDSDNSTHEHKMLVLEVFHNLCTDAQGLVEIFLSYDADFDSVDIFRHIVVALARVVKGRADLPQGASAASVSSDVVRRAAAADAALRRLALSGLVATLRSLAKCCDVSIDHSSRGGGGGGGHGDDDDDDDHRKASAAAAAAASSSLPGSESTTSLASVAATAPRKPPTPAPDPLVQKSSEDDEAAPRAGSVESFDLKQKIQEDLREGILQFNLNPKNGIATLARKGHIEMTPESVATFLRANAGRLSKTKIGEYLGREKEYQSGFCVKVLHAYVDSLDFTGMEFDVAIRHFLSGFRLPGEAQKIDRMMEKFAERYCIVNKNIFPSADVAFVLAFSVIMLQTDLHNPAIKEERRMTKEAFRRNNRGICEGKDLDDAFLDAIFDRIKTTPITLEEDDQQRRTLADKQTNGAPTSVFFGANPSRRKAELFHREREDMVRSSVSILRQGRPAFSPGFSTTTTTSSPPPVPIPPPEEGAPANPTQRLGAAALAAPKMFEVAWGPALSAFSHALERLFAGPNPTALALQGLEISACVAAVLGLDVARESVVNALASFTTLHNRTTKQLLPRHAACIETLLGLPRNDDCADALGSSWLPVLQIASRVAHFRLLAQGLATDDAFFAGLDDNHDEAAAKHVAAARQRDVESAKALASLTKLADSDVDNIYARSTRLSASGVESFVIHLCAVSAAELSSGDPLDAGGTYAATTTTTTAAAATAPSEDGDVHALPPLGSPPRPRVYSLQRLVDVADANVSSRPRLAWDRIWRVLAAHFARAGAHANADVAKYAVDSLRQLSLKFLCKEELREFSFQRSFLRPFERVFAAAQRSEHPNRAAVREYVVECVDALVLSRADSIRSGWRSIFAVYAAAAHDDEPHVADLAYASLDRIVGQYLDHVALDFVELVNCVVAFAAAPRARPQVALSALKRLDECSAALADGRVSTAIRNNNRANDNNQRVLDATDQKQGSSSSSSPSKEEDEEEEDDHESAAEDGNDARLELWWPLLLGLAQRVADPRVAVRNGALATLRRALERDCDSFSAETWRLVFRGVLFPSLESAWTDDAPQPSSTRPTDEAPDPSSAPRDDASWLTSTAPALLETCVSLYAARGGGRESAALLSELLGALGDCVCQDVEALSRLAVDALRATLDAVGHLEPPAPRETWDVAVHGLASLVRRALPAELREYAAETSGLPEESRAAMAQRLARRLPRAPTIARLVASLRLLPLCDGLLVAAADDEALDERAADAMLLALDESWTFARTFDDDGVLRFAFWEAKLMGDDPPDLVAHRVCAARAALSALSALRSKPRYRVLAEPRLLELCRDILHEYAESDKAAENEDAASDRRLAPPSNLSAASTPLALAALDVVKALDSDTFSRHCSWLVPVLSELIVCRSVELRSAVAAVFATRLPTALASRESPADAPRPPLRRERDDSPRPPIHHHQQQEQQPQTPAKKTAPDSVARDSSRATPRHPGAVVKPYRLFESQ
ncbi:hypothetical protein CTAYLR_002304 [Chrysophaeum taylorii]|uniref:SEC7 domain-containing protein n=1 Tax=Chrysophaeum taylorii TaxID=2483200 RepID=A0AAD7UPI0_9STRA|nr:hypothetical protein CTAYLR_002304 [Chrysophaeum taylorii]